MANERVRGHDLGTTGKTVAANISRVRKSQQILLQELEERLTKIGHRISFSGLSKIERGERRVDVDDLMAIAVALDVSPLGLLLPVDVEPAAIIDTTGAKGSAALFWQWATATQTHFTLDNRGFEARSVPWWLWATAEIRWRGDLELLLARPGHELERVERIHFTEPSDESDGDERQETR
jgi:transcriptional regulator with XRE-family HTH domain